MNIEEAKKKLKNLSLKMKKGCEQHEAFTNKKPKVSNLALPIRENKKMGDLTKLWECQACGFW